MCVCPCLTIKVGASPHTPSCQPMRPWPHLTIKSRYPRRARLPLHRALAHTSRVERGEGRAAEGLCGGGDFVGFSSPVHFLAARFAPASQWEMEIQMATDKPTSQTQSQGSGQSQTQTPKDSPSTGATPPTGASSSAPTSSSEGHMAGSTPPADPKSVEAKAKPDNWDSFTTHEDTSGHGGPRVVMPGTGGEPPATGPEPAPKAATAAAPSPSVNK